MVGAAEAAPLTKEYIGLNSRLLTGKANFGKLTPLIKLKPVIVLSNDQTKVLNMKAGIHPEYNEVTINCVCGASYQTKSTAKLEKIDICAACHPFYTGKQKVLDTEGRIEKFRKKFGSRYASRSKKSE